MKNILVPIGSLENAANVLQYAIDFVEGTGAKIYIIRAYGVTKMASSMKNIDTILVQESKDELEALLNMVEAKGVDIISKSVKGAVPDSLQLIAKQLDIDLVIASAKGNTKKNKVFLGKVAGGLIKDTNTPVLIIPKNYKFKKIGKVLMALKSGIISSPEVLSPLKDILSRFAANLDLIRVVTPHSIDGDATMNADLENLKESFKTTENATVFQGVLEHIHEYEPDMLCVIRRKRGFFTRLWQKDKVYKKNFESRVPLLILKGEYQL